jgi:hypothetical protein
MHIEHAETQNQKYVAPERRANNLDSPQSNLATPQPYLAPR